MIEDETDFNLVGIIDSSAPPEELDDVPWNHETEPDALVGVQDPYHGFPNIKYLTERPERDIPSLEPELGMRCQSSVQPHLQEDQGQIHIQMASLLMI